MIEQVDLVCWTCLLLLFTRPINTVSFHKQPHAAIPPREYPDPSEPGSQARSGPASTRVGDHLGSPGAACFVLLELESKSTRTRVLLGV